MDARMKWDQLDEASRAKLLERYRDINVMDEWWDGEYEAFRNQCNEIGIEVSEIYFSGFWCQGDGACFTGHVSDWPKFLLAAGMPQLAELAKRFYQTDDVERTLSLSWAHTGCYCHENSVTYDSDLEVNNPYNPDADPLRHAVWEKSYGQEGPFVSCLEDAQVFLRSLMRGLYSGLEATYVALTSDDEISTYIVEEREDEIVCLL